MRLLLIALLASCSSALAQTMVWGVSNAHKMPYFSGDGRGIVELLATRMQQNGWQIEIVELPRTRLQPALLGGAIDAIAITNPNWVTDPARFVFSDSYLLQPMVLVGENAKHVDDFVDLQGLNLVQFAGYKYVTEFEQVAALDRADIYRPEQGYQMLLAGRSDILIIDGIIFAYDQARQPSLQSLTQSNLFVSADRVHFGLDANHEQQSEFVDALNQMIEGLGANASVRQNYVLNAILD